MVIDPGPEAFARAFGRLHSALVHFPIGILVAAAAIEALAVLRGRRTLEPGTRPLLFLGATGALLAVAAGWLNAAHEAHGSALAAAIERHRWFGVATLACALVAVVAGRRTLIVRLALGLAALGALLGGHQGGEIAWGSGYVSAPLRASEPPPPATPPASEYAPSTAAAAIGFADVEAIFVEHCARCHGERRQKADLRVDSHEALVGGDRAAWLVVPGDAAGSELWRRISLAADDPDAMPPEEPWLDDGAKERIHAWIEAGALP